MYLYMRHKQGLEGKRRKIRNLYADVVSGSVSPRVDVIRECQSFGSIPRSEEVVFSSEALSKILK